MRRAALGEDTIKLVQVLVEVEDCARRAYFGYKGMHCREKVYAPLTATHSMTSAYFGSMTMVLKLPFTSAASTKGLHRYSGFGTEGLVGVAGGSESVDGKFADVGVVDRLGGRWLRCIDRL